MPSSGWTYLWMQSSADASIAPSNGINFQSSTPHHEDGKVCDQFGSDMGRVMTSLDGDGRWFVVGLVCVWRWERQIGGGTSGGSGGPPSSVATFERRDQENCRGRFEDSVHKLCRPPYDLTPASILMLCSQIDWILLLVAIPIIFKRRKWI